MPTVTAILPQPRHKDRVNLFVDGEFSMGLHLALAQESGLSIGRRLSYQDLRALADREELLTGMDTAYRYLAFRPRSGKEVRDRLRRKKIHLRIIDQVIARLRDQRFLDDTSFAQQWVANREAYRPRSRRMMQWELRLKGVDEELARDAVEEVDDEDAAYRAAQRRAERLGPADYELFRKRVGDFLLRRGFGYAVVARTLQRFWQEHAGNQAVDDQELVDAAALAEDD